MFRLVYRNLFHDRIRTVLTTLAIGSVVALILVLEGFEAGLAAQLQNAVLDRRADLIVTQAGISNFTATRSVLPQLTRRKVEAVTGVKMAHPMTGLPVIYQQDGQKTPVFLLVFESAGGPSSVIDGSSELSDGQIVVDEALARKYGLEPGQRIEISDYPFDIAGISSETSALFTPYAFIQFDDLIDLYLESNLAADISVFPLLSFLLVELESGAVASEIARELELTAAEIDVHSPQTLAENDARLGRTLFGSVLQLLVGIGYGIGVVVVAMLMFASVQARTRELGIIKALGFGEGRLRGSILLEAVAVTVCAFPIGIFISWVGAELIHHLFPLYLVLPLQSEALVRTLMSSLGFSLIGALAPLRLISGIEPGIVFRG